MSDKRGLYEVPDFYDYLKHLTTLSTGSLVVLATFVQNSSSPRRSVLIFGLSVVCFLISVVSSIMCMLFTLSWRRYTDNNSAPSWEGSAIAVLFMVTAFTLFLGILFLAIFGVANFAI